jgi:hypothetical protein
VIGCFQTVPEKSHFRQARFSLDGNSAFLELIPSTLGVLTELVFAEAVQLVLVEAATAEEVCEDEREDRMTG